MSTLQRVHRQNRSRGRVAPEEAFVCVRAVEYELFNTQSTTVYLVFIDKRALLCFGC